MTDTLQPNVLTVNPDGTIGANLTGHLKAQGVDLPGGTTNSPTSDERVRWLAQSNGSVLADITATDESNPVTGFGIRRATWELISPDGTAAYELLAGAPRGSVQATVTAGNQFAKVLDSQGHSDFALSAQPAWTAPALAAGWTNLGAPYARAGYRFDTLGNVCLEGVVPNAAPAVGSLIFTLPAGYRPAARKIFAVLDAQKAVAARVDIDTAGNVLWYGTAGSTVIPCLDSIPPFSTF